MNSDLKFKESYNKILLPICSLQCVQTAFLNNLFGNSIRIGRSCLCCVLLKATRYDTVGLPRDFLVEFELLLINLAFFLKKRKFLVSVFLSYSEPLWFVQRKLNLKQCISISNHETNEFYTCFLSFFTYSPTGYFIYTIHGRVNFKGFLNKYCCCYNVDIYTNYNEGFTH